jgi:hypothetical protein
MVRYTYSCEHCSGYHITKKKPWNDQDWGHYRVGDFWSGDRSHKGDTSVRHRHASRGRPPGEIRGETVKKEGAKSPIRCPIPIYM